MKASPYSKKRFCLWKNVWPPLNEIDEVEGLANFFLLSFLKLDDLDVFSIDKKHRKLYKLEDELINLGSLVVSSVSKLEDDSFFIHIAEANSRRLENFVEEQMRKWVLERLNA